MKSITLSPTDRMFHQATHKVILDYTDVAGIGAAANGTIAIFPTSGTFPAGTRARLTSANLTTAFLAAGGDGDATNLVVEVGDGSDVDRLLTSTELLTAATEILFKVEGAVTQPYAYLVADTIDAKFTISGGTTPLCTDASAGVLELYLYIDDLNLLERPGGALSTT